VIHDVNRILDGHVSNKCGVEEKREIGRLEGREVVSVVVIS
jgi:hypothetical protein